MSDQGPQWNWRDYFSDVTLRNGKSDDENGYVQHFECDPKGHWARCTTRGGFHVNVLKAPASYDELRAYPNWFSLTTGRYTRGGMAFSRYYYCPCSQGIQGIRCRHLASLLYHWESVRGPFVFEESEEARAERLKKEEVERQRKQKLEEMRRKKENVFQASDYIHTRVTKAPRELFFPMDDILKTSQITTDQYETEQATAMLNQQADPGLQMQTAVTAGHGQWLEASGHFGNNSISMTISPKQVEKFECSCGVSRMNYSYWSSERRGGKMCCHALVLWLHLREAVIRENPGDETDYRGFAFLDLMTGGTSFKETMPAANIEPEIVKQPNVTLTPRIVRENGDGALKLNFDIGRAGQRSYAVKGLEGLVNAVEEEKSYAASKALTVDFAQETFTEEADEWYQLIQSRVRVVKSVNEKLNRSYYNYGHLAAGTGIPLKESDLDIVYDIASGGTIQYQFGKRTELRNVRVGAASPRVEIRLDPIKSGTRLTGIAVAGIMPRLLQGSLHQYILDKTYFGRVSDDDISFLASMQGLVDSTGAFTFTIGEKKLAEFYHRVLPSLQENPQITILDNVGSLIDGLLPPEPQFTFYLDLGAMITCETFVRYDAAMFHLGDPNVTLLGSQRDLDQERRVMQAVRYFFPQTDPKSHLPGRDHNDDDLLRIKTDGVNALSQFGEVRGSDAFSRVRIRPAPQPRFSVQLDGGMLDLSIKTKDINEEELLDLLATYRQKKRWHRLSSGDYVDLQDAEALKELDEAAQDMDVSLEELVRGAVHMPKYRALYVDKLMEEHEEIATSRDRLFKGLIRSFQTIRDSDFEASDTLMEQLRPYQLYGFRWLCTLAQAGFGGILADEMGLGKTIQMLAFIETQKAHGSTQPSLVVCPASLVYNWKEECRRFTPALSVETIAGTLRQRKQMLSDMNADLYITSYDLLKRDIALYDGLSFSVIVLDEAQYIKNQKAAVSKAVRVLKGEHRFALTGTPIENRLSELWSIFDFLMPGFLYSSSEFSSRFEGPIMKQKDAVITEKLARMTSPFILRRKKTDVLKDLPEKLEETRSAEMDEEQRKLYDAQLVRMKALLASSNDSGEDKMRILAEITRLRQICCDPRLLFDNYEGASTKREACLELIESAIDGGHRMLVFSQFTSMLELLAKDLRAASIPFYTLTGATPKLERIRLVNAFNDGDVPVFLISLKAGGTGLNLTGADVVIHYDPWWNLAVQNQATDRAHRIGQTKQVTVIKLIAAETIEEKIIQLQEAKRELADAIISGENTSLMSLSKDELLELLG